MLPSTHRPHENVRRITGYRTSRPATAHELTPHRREFVARVDFEGARAVLRPCGEIDIAALPDLIALARSAVTRSATRLVLIDLSEVTFLDAAGCAGLEQIHLACEKHRKPLRLQGACPEVRRVLDLVEFEHRVAW